MPTIIDQALMFAVVFAIAYLGYRIKGFLFPAVSAEELGYAPGSERPSCGWCIPFLVGLALFALLLFGPTAAARIIGL